MSLRLVSLVGLAALALSACDSSNDDDDDGAMPGPGGQGGGQGGGDNVAQPLDRAADFVTIASRGATDAPYALDGDALLADLSMRFGDANGEPSDIGDADDVLSVANRPR